MMRPLLTLLCASLLAACASNPSFQECGLMRDPATGLITRAPSKEPTAIQKQRSEKMRYGMFLCWGINTFVDQEWTDGTIPVEKYAPKEIAAEEWVLAAKKAGMSHVLLIAKHHDGFCTWPTQFDELKYSVAFTSNKTDVLKAVADACKKHDVNFAIYYSAWDRRWDAQHADLIKSNPDAAHKAYAQYMVHHIDELMTQYGPVTEFWIDGCWTKNAKDWHCDVIYDAIKRHQPACQVTWNWSIALPGEKEITPNITPEVQKEGYPIRYFPGDFRTSDPYVPVANDPKVFTHNGAPFYMPFETTVCANDVWFWNSTDKGLKSVETLEKLYLRSTAENNLLILNCPPGPDGHMRANTVLRLEELANKLGLKAGEPFPANPLDIKK